MSWQKLGVIWNSEIIEGHQPGAMIPTPIHLPKEKKIRIYFSARDKLGRGLPYYIEVDEQNPAEVVTKQQGPLLTLGAPGTFDANGAVVCSLVEVSENIFYMYYVGFEIPSDIRYRMFIGLAVSHDAGKTFQKYSRAPVLDRSDAELYFRCGPFAEYIDGKFRLWYVAGSEWLDINGTISPSYDLKYQESMDGIHWEPEGMTVLKSNFEDYAFGRPWIYEYSGSKHMIISARKRARQRYELENYVLSSDQEWTEVEAELKPGLLGIDDQMITYASILKVRNKYFCFYNGNNFGESGICLAEFF